MSESRETTLNESPFALSPGTKRDTFHWPKYSLIVGTITTTEVNASDAVGCQAFAGSIELGSVENECVRGGGEDACASGSTSPNSTLPSPSRSTFAARARAGCPTASPR